MKKAGKIALGVGGALAAGAAAAGVIYAKNRKKNNKVNKEETKAE